MVLRINDHAGAEHVHGLVAQDAGRHEIEHELALVVDDAQFCRSLPDAGWVF